MFAGRTGQRNCTDDSQRRPRDSGIVGWWVEGGEACGVAVNRAASLKRVLSEPGLVKFAFGVALVAANGDRTASDLFSAMNVGHHVGNTPAERLVDSEQTARQYARSRPNPSRSLLRNAGP